MQTQHLLLEVLLVDLRHYLELDLEDPLQVEGEQRRLVVDVFLIELLSSPYSTN